MSATEPRPIPQAFYSPPVFGLLVLIAIFFPSPRAHSAVLPLGNEQDSWSDMLFPSGFGTFSDGLLTISTQNVPVDLEVGSQFGPSNPGWHYGTGGTRGGNSPANLIISRLFLNPDGTLKNNDSIVTLSYGGNSAGSLGTDYKIGNGSALLRGKVTEVLLDAAGNDTLDILFTISGGALQEIPNPDHSIGKFAPVNVGLFRITAPGLPSNWTSNFEFDAISLYIFGIPEPGTCLMLCVAGLLMSSACPRRHPRR